MATQQGATVKIGFNSQTYSGHVMESQSIEATGEEEIIKDESGNTTTVITFDPGTRINFTAVILDAGALTPPTVGAAVSINSITYRVESANIDFAIGANRLTATAIKESSMTYS